MLSRRPGKRAARQQVKVYMKNRLPGIPAVIDDQAVPSRVKPQHFGKISGDEKQMTDKFTVFRVHALNVFDMFFGHNQDVCRRLRVDIFEGNGHLIAVYEFRRDLAINDLAKKAVRIMAHHDILPQENRLKKQLRSPV